MWPKEKIKGKHTLSRHEETKEGVSTMNANKGGLNTHQLETRRQKGV